MKGRGSAVAAVLGSHQGPARAGGPMRSPSVRPSRPGGGASAPGMVPGLRAQSSGRCSGHRVGAAGAAPAARRRPHAARRAAHKMTAREAIADTLAMDETRNARPARGRARPAAGEPLGPPGGCCSSAAAGYSRTTSSLAHRQPEPGSWRAPRSRPDGRAAAAHQRAAADEQEAQARARAIERREDVAGRIERMLEVGAPHRRGRAHHRARRATT